LYSSAAGGSISRNKTRPRRVQIPKDNFYITSPFKQGPEKDVKGSALVRLLRMKRFSCFMQLKDLTVCCM